MRIQILTSVLLCLAVLPMACVSLEAQGFEGHGDVILSNPHGGMVNRPMRAVMPGESPEGLYTIYSNLGQNPDAYDLTFGIPVEGPQGPLGEQWIAVPFTPTSNAEVTEIEVALGYVTGFNGVTISLNKDNNGVPGTAIRTWNPTNLFLAGGCCHLRVVKAPKGKKVRQGVQYWVVASTNTSTETTYDTWSVNYLGELGEFAFLNSGSGNQWFTTSKYPLPAVGVFGKEQ